MLSKSFFRENREKVRAVLPPSGIRFRTWEVSGDPAMLELFGNGASDKEYHARIGQELSLDKRYFHIREVGKSNERGVLWERV
jgi:hypothetical protein